MRLYKTWTELKNFINSKHLLLQYHEYEYEYIIFATETDGNEYFTELWKDTSKVEGINITQNNIDLTDFEDNYKASANQSPYKEGQQINVNVTGGTIDNVGIKNSEDARINPAKEDGNLASIKESIGQESGTTLLSRIKDLWDKLHDLFVGESGNPANAKIRIHDGQYQTGVTAEGRLKVDGKWSGSVSINRYRLNFYNSKTPITLNDTFQELTNINFDGQLDAIHILFDRDDVEVSINIDGEEKLKVILEDLVDSSLYNLAKTESPNFPIRLGSNGKQFEMVFIYPSDITSNITIKAKRTTESETIMKSILVVYRKKVT